ncbi:MAG: type II toxin-antitoxin system RelE/ParE family toxin [Woeseia sp.]
MSRRLIVEPGAESDIEDGYGWYEERQSGLGARFLTELDTTLVRISENSASYQEVVPEIRRAVTHVFPYLVFFTHTDQAVYILAVVPATQDPELLASKLLR